MIQRVSFSHYAISDEISRRGCRIYFSLKMLKNKVTGVKKSSDDTFHSKFQLMIISGKHRIFRNSTSLFVGVAFSFVTINDVASHILLLGIFQFVKSLVSFPQSKENNWVAVFLAYPLFSRFLSFSSFLFLSSFLSFSAHILNLQNLETLTKLCTLLLAYHSPLRISKQRLTAGLQKPPSLKESEKKENDNRNNFRVNPARVINWLQLGAWEVERVSRRRRLQNNAI